MFPRFLVVGTIGFIIDAGCTLLLVDAAGWPAGLARLPAFLIASWATYRLNRAWTFKERSGEPLGWSAYALATGVGAALNYATYSATVVAFGTSSPSIVGGVAAGALVGLGFNYLMSSRVVFRG